MDYCKLLEMYLDDINNFDADLMMSLCTNDLDCDDCEYLE
jgi:hypothetical protein